MIRRPQRTLTPQERERVRSTSSLNLQGALIVGITDPVPNPSPMSEDEGQWVREQVWPQFITIIDRKYPFGFWRWSTCELGTCWNCRSRRCDLCVHRQQGGPNVDQGFDWVHNAQGMVVAKLILRPGGEPCVWWCRCPCSKSGPLPEPERAELEAVVELPETAAASTTERGRRPGARGDAQEVLF
ncbi:DUF6248 family natural product biosynthesis protein [Streptomyces griseoviridis]|uniref:DUF6248 family natural product biosynthesis protein n=1 Tax=Streptomyces griseoviridis TaxID=45398 RepID=UPI00344EDA56